MTDEQRERLLDRLLENHAHHDAVLQKLEELQMTDQIAISRLNNRLPAFQEQTKRRCSNSTTACFAWRG